MPEVILNEYVWYNKHIQVENRAVYDKIMAESGILKVSDVWNRIGRFKSFAEIKIRV